MNGTLQRYLGKLVTVLAPVLYGFAHGLSAGTHRQLDRGLDP